MKTFKAWVTADFAHRNQSYGRLPYIVHLQNAFDVAIRFGIKDEDVLSAVILHDTVEDTSVTLDDLKGDFGERVAEIVDVVTEPSGLSRKERHAYSHPRIRDREEARLVKLCDRISHVEFGGEKVKMYRKEHPTFKLDLYPENPGPIEKSMWDHLDKLIEEV